MSLEFQAPRRAVYRLKGVTPFHTGGVESGKSDQFHPSGFLGALRFFSVGLARALGVEDFETTVWGESEANKHRSKSVALSWDVSKVELVKPRGKVSVPKNENEESSWFFNQELKGELGLSVVEVHPLSQVHWELLQLAIQLQTRFASWGAKDQFGLGVFELAEASHQVDFSVFNHLPSSARLEGCGLFEVGFFTLQVKKLYQADPAATGLALRQYLRNQFRKTNEEKALRHRLFGALRGREPSASAVQVSWVYSLAGQQWVRVWYALPHSKDFLEHHRGDLPRVREGLDQVLTSPVSLACGAEFLPASSLKWQLGQSPSAILSQIQAVWEGV